MSFCFAVYGRGLLINPLIQMRGSSVGAVLGLGFGMGWTKFHSELSRSSQKISLVVRISLSDAQSQNIVNIYPTDIIIKSRRLGTGSKAYFLYCHIGG